MTRWLSPGHLRGSVPLDLAGAGLVAGILFAAARPHRTPCELALALGLAALGALLAGGARTCRWDAIALAALLVALGALTGATRWRAAAALPPPVPIERLPRRPLHWEVRLDEAPRRWAGRWRLAGRLGEASREGFAGLAVSVHYRGELEETPSTGCTLEIFGRLEGERPRRNEPARWWRPRRAPRYRLLAQRVDGMHCPTGQIPALWHRGLARLTVAATDRLEAAAEAPRRGLAAPSASLLAALLLGDKSALDGEVRRRFRRLGAYHLLVVSGLHVGILVALLAAFLWRRRDGRLQHRLGAGLLLLILLLFAFFLRFQVSVLRACLMVGLCAGAHLVGRWPRGRRILWVTFLANLLFRPQGLFEVGFQLTYGATWGLVVLLPRLLPPRAWGPTDRGRLRVLLGDVGRAQIAATVCTLPILALHFHRVAPAGLLAGPLLGTLIGPLLVMGLVSLLGGGLGLFAPCRWVTDGLARLLLTLADHLDRWLGRTVSVSAPGPGGLVLFAALIAWGLATPRRPRKATALATMALLYTTLLAQGIPRAPALTGGDLGPDDATLGGPGLLELVMLDVGNGDALILRLPDGTTWLVDGGGADGHRDMGRDVVAPYLLDRGVRRLDGMILSHPHLDHYGGLVVLAETFRPTRFWAGLGFGRPALRPLRRALGRAGTEVELLDDEARHRPFDANTNNLSLVQRVTYGNLSILLPGDAEAAAESGLCRYGQALASTVLKAPHHGSRTSSTVEFLQRVRPRVILVSADATASYGHPHPDTLARYAAVVPDALVLRTDVHGRIRLRSDGRRLCVDTVAGLQRCFNLSAKR